MELNKLVATVDKKEIIVQVKGEPEVKVPVEQDTVSAALAYARGNNLKVQDILYSERGTLVRMTRQFQTSESHPTSQERFEMHPTNKYVEKTADQRFKEILQAGAFPEVEYKKDPDGFESIMLMEYVQIKGQMMRLLNFKLVKAGYLDGVRSNLRNKAFLTTVRMICDNITAEEIAAHAY
jgi:hypothetical protein